MDHMYNMARDIVQFVTTDALANSHSSAAQHRCDELCDFMQFYGVTAFEPVQLYIDAEKIMHDISHTNDEMVGRDGRIIGVRKDEK